MIDNCTVIIRSVGERTENVCYQLLAQIFPSDNIFIIKATPFSESIRQSFLKGIENNLPWTLCIDADVLVDISELPKLLDKAKTLEKDVFEIQGLIIDKFIPVKRPAGNHLYRTSLLHKAIDCIPTEGTSLRPETDMLNKMVMLGYPWVQCDLVVGLHDFEQYFSDVYRKCFLQAHKHKYLDLLLESLWEDRSRTDLDFKVAFDAYHSGKKFSEQLYVDKKFLDAEIDNYLTENSITEKQCIANLPFSELLKHSNQYYLQSLQEKAFPTNRWNTIYTKPPNQKASNKSLLFKIGFKIEQLGKKVKSLSAN